MRKIGRYEIGFLVTEHFGLDGGAMFGAVPRVLWERQIKPDSSHRIPLCSRILVLRGPEGTAIVDCGNGDKWSDKLRAMFEIKQVMSANLQKVLPDVSSVILTHLHFDHAAGVTRLDEGGTPVLTYPSATHYLLEANWERANAPGLRERASYMPDTVQPLKKAKLKLLDQQTEILPGITGHRSDGHTLGLQWILIKDLNETVAYPSDLIPTAHHVPIPYVMGYDLWPERTMEEKAEFLRLASEGNWLVIFEHDQETVGGRIEEREEINSPSSAKISPISNYPLEAPAGRQSLGLIIFSLLLIIPGIFVSEFFRHTEADRTLISWEMLERGDFVLPHLLGTPILTKPPLFYWMVAASLRFFSSTAEWAARMPSALMAILLVQIQFWMVLALQGGRKLAFLSSLILLTSPLFLQLASVAEIDATFAALGGLSLFALLLAHERRSFALFLVAYLSGGLAALAKGPVALGLTVALDILFSLRSLKRRELRTRSTGFVLARSAARIFSLFSLAALINFAWYWKVAERLSWREVLIQQSFEILRRFQGLVASDHGIFFYPWSLLLGTLPWSLLAAYALWRSRRSEFTGSARLLDSAVLVCLVVLTVLCCAKGKSSRYSLVIYPFFSILLAAAIQRLSDRRLLFLTLCAAVCARAAEVGIYHSYRNHSRSVRPIVSDLETRLNPDQPLYVLESQKRWISYYLKRRNISSIRMTHETAERLSAENLPVQLLLSSDDESWRIPKLRDADPSTEILKEYDTIRSQVMLLKTTPRALAALSLQKNFPTIMMTPPQTNSGSPDNPESD